MCSNFSKILIVAILSLFFIPNHAQSYLWSKSKTLDEEMTELSKLDFEELMNIEITSVSKKAQKVSEAAAAIFVITNEDIQRSGVTSIPEALRMVPGLEVARIDASTWAITCRGFNGRFANKLLVLMDGRSIYTPLFSGVFWDVQDTLLEDLDRIEVIRGPGATLWGANAVNGVINIITKQAKDTQGGLVTAGVGTEERGLGSVRYGGKLNDDTYYRVYAKYFDRDSAVDVSGHDGADEWHVLRGGFRMDWEPANSNSLTLQGDIYDGDAGQRLSVTSLTAPYTRTFDEDTEITGAYLLSRWKRTISDNSDIMLQLYYDRTERNTAVMDESRDTFDIEFQHQFSLSERQEFIWGLGYRFTSDDIDNTFSLSFYPDNRDDNLFSAFLQDEIMLIEDRLHLTLGSKFEHNDYTGFEIQPSVRLIWTPYRQHSVWTAVSRAVRTPSRAEEDVRINQKVFPGSPPRVVSLFGNHDFDSEELIAYELGYRVQLMDRLSLDIAAFYNDYDDLRTEEPGEPFPETSPSPPHLVIPYTAGNKMKGETYGIELAADWRVLDWWRLQAAYTYLQMQLHLDGDSRDMRSVSAEGESPHNQVSLRSSMDLTRDLDFDLWLRYVDNLPSQDVGSYITLDARLGWKLYKDIELSVVGQNLLDSHRLEFEPEILDTYPTEVERSVYGKITWRF